MGIWPGSACPCICAQQVLWQCQRRVTRGIYELPGRQVLSSVRCSTIHGTFTRAWCASKRAVSQQRMYQGWRKQSWHYIPGNFSHFWVGPSQKHVNFQFCSDPSSICSSDLLQSFTIARHFRQSWMKPGSRPTRDNPSEGLNFNPTSNATSRLLNKTEPRRKMNFRTSIDHTT